jgi:hypothetical protein
VPETAPQQAFEMLQVGLPLDAFSDEFVGFAGHFSQLLAAVDIGCPVLGGPLGQLLLQLKMS